MSKHVHTCKSFQVVPAINGNELLNLVTYILLYIALQKFLKWYKYRVLPPIKKKTNSVCFYIFFIFFTTTHYYVFLQNNAGISSPCDTAPCHNGGICIEDLEDWTYQCICSESLTSDNCQDGKYSIKYITSASLMQVH